MTRNSPPNWDELSATARARFPPSDGEEEQFVPGEHFGAPEHAADSPRFYMTPESQGVDAPVFDVD